MATGVGTAAVASGSVAVASSSTAKVALGVQVVGWVDGAAVVAIRVDL